jgi:hypothetical protein
VAQVARGVRIFGGGPLRIAASVLLAAAVAVAVWLIVKGNETSKPTAASSTASAATLKTLRALPREVGHPVYWAGTRRNYTHELTEIDGNLFLRYLPPGVAVGDPRADYLIVGTYPEEDAYRALQRQARRPGHRRQRAAGGGIAVWSERSPQSVYLAFPGGDVKAEIYDASAVRARRLAVTGAVEPIR